MVVFLDVNLVTMNLQYDLVCFKPITVVCAPVSIQAHVQSLLLMLKLINLRGLSIHF